MISMIRRSMGILAAIIPLCLNATTISNPLIWSDVPDVSVVRVGNSYYTASTTMHMNPGVPIMESTDLVHWKTIHYAYTTLANSDALNLTNGADAYGKGSWAPSIRHKNGTFYVLVPSYTTGKTHLFRTTNIHGGTWEEVTFPFYHDPSLLLDDDGRNYVIYGAGDIKIVELTSDLSAVKPGGTNMTLIANATAASGSSAGLAAEGAHIEKVNGYYYVFLICWPSGNSRTELVFRSSTLTGNYTGQIAMQSNGVAQGGIFQAADNAWWAILFQDNGAVGRSPWLIPVTWQNDWPVFGTNGSAPNSITLSTSAQEDGYGMVVSDDFTTTELFREWQWNHNPLNTHWSLSARPGFFRITTSRVDADLASVRNMLTQRSYGPKSSGQVAIETANMKDGDVAGLSAFQKNYGYVAVKMSGGNRSIVMVNASSGTPSQVASIPLSQDRVYLRVDMDFTNRTDKATFFYSLNGTTWTAAGNTLQMSYTIPHFMGYRFGLFHFATISAGGYVDFDSFKIGKAYDSTIPFGTSGGSSSLASSSSSMALQIPFCSMAQIPGTVQMENYDNGGQDNAYSDTDVDNNGGKYRQDDVDIDTTEETGYVLAWNLTSEWVEYTVLVTEAGAQPFEARVASSLDGAAFHLEIDGVAVTSSIIVPNTGAWNIYQTVKGTTQSITADTHILRFVVDGSYFNIDWIQFGDGQPTSVRSRPSTAGVRPSSYLKYDMLGRIFQ